MTLGLHEIRAARRIVLLATGAEKAEILAALFHEPPSSQRPASLLLDHPRFTILADAAAAAGRKGRAVERGAIHRG
jgi:glucosamine-6-phosphate deaminase